MIRRIFWIVLAGCSGRLDGTPADPATGTDARADPGDMRDASGKVTEAGALAVRDSGAPDVSTHPEILPVVMLTVDGKTPETLGDVKVAGQLRLIVDHDGSLLKLAGRHATLESAIGISLRGASSRKLPQKPFGIELRDASGEERKLPVLGMPAEGDWALVPCYSDKPCMRNALAYSIGQRFGRWTPQLRFVEVIFNDTYQGLYQLVELPRLGKRRINSQKAAREPAAGDITGAYLFSREGSGKGKPTDVPPLDWLSPTTSPGPWVNQIVYSYRSPGYEEITDTQRRYLRDHMAAFEEMMKSAIWADPTSGYRAWLDVPSWIDQALMNELTNNIDGYAKSMYFVKEPDPPGGRGKLVLEPIWDFNLGFGNADFRNGWRFDLLNLKALTDEGGGCGSDWLPHGPPFCDSTCCEPKTMCQPPLRCWNSPNVPFYWTRLWSDASFLDELRCRWERLRAPDNVLSLMFIDQAILEWEAQLAPLAIPRHLARWPELYGYVWPNPYSRDPTTAPKPGATATQLLDGEVRWFRSWIARRVAYLDAHLPGVCRAP